VPRTNGLAYFVRDAETGFKPVRDVVATNPDAGNGGRAAADVGQVAAGVNPQNFFLSLLRANKLECFVFGKP
jgi:hypothetical protein